MAGGLKLNFEFNVECYDRELAWRGSSPLTCELSQDDVGGRGDRVVAFELALQRGDRFLNHRVVHVMPTYEPARGSVDSMRLENTQNQPSSNPARMSRT